MIFLPPFVVSFNSFQFSMQAMSLFYYQLKDLFSLELEQAAVRFSLPDNVVNRCSVASDEGYWMWG